MVEDDEDEDEDEGDEDEAGVDEDEVREALLELRTGDGTLQHVLCLAAAAGEYEVQLVPPEVVEAVAAVYEMDRDADNGGLDQFVWNHGVEMTRTIAAALRAVGALENADVLDRLATALAAREAEVGREALADEPVAQFLAFRRAVGGPFFAIPPHREEAGEALLEYVLERAEALPEFDGELRPRAAVHGLAN